MTTKAYFLIRSAASVGGSRSAACIRDLEAMPEVRRVYRVLGQYDLLVTVEAPANVLPVADKILANIGVESLAISFSPIGPEMRPRAA
jgi:DNA-binding Lrp family transcriptional regulator